LSRRISDLIEEEEMASSLPEVAHAMFRLMLDLFAGLNGKIADLDKEIARRAREDEVSRRLMTVPGIGPISATAIAALAPPVETFAKSRDFAQTIVTAPTTRAPSAHKEGWKPIGVIQKGPHGREFWTKGFAHTGLISDIVFWSAQGRKGPICFAKQLREGSSPRQ
jgi:hypothetical protein